ncbi:uncharacterized protein ASPGLDRAFT_77756 [Aspergillus glaucus CBS 516.65]|uniref:Glycosyl transferase CAP10 domain-containing protein n=1 Tax=Aspergillus glaucus CBS 516.65 TaxID=1160497 RepID=A0A1L9V5S4_ASPGL|nr:hypothetical protein ASPGLDRAFT_77756 [Aspergillus glaucus CBS 516.65]OJJ79273.1 hypothetical protein ASPGLDRAFT_77756 [Aspergillus glaucus CBS 516.65]
MVDEAQRSFEAVKSRQSRSLPEAVAEYKRRYGLPPPPHFDKWYEFAVARGTVLVDEFDTIYHNLLPFWALEPKTIRSRTREDLGYDNRLVGISIRQGKSDNRGEGQGNFQSTAIQAMVSSFAHLLPDMDLAFNIHDEPRVVVPHDSLDKMVTLGREVQSRLLLNEQDLKNQFSKTPGQLDEDIANNPRTRFHDIGMQETWLFSRLSCPLDSPARQLNGGAPDNPDILGDASLGLISNHTAFSDICQTPSLQYRLGFFDKPNACKLSPELTPVFSMSKLSSFQDILYPSPWYYTDQIYFDKDKAVDWDQHITQLYWRGATSGGFSDKGTWRQQLRQYLVDELTHSHSNTTELILSQKRPGPEECNIWEESWDLKEAHVKSNELFNIKFTEVKQCSTTDCDEEDAYFDTARREKQSEAWKYRYLLDMDGNAYSGRFYAFLQSYAVIMKLSFFREWHENILFPWVHYVPLSLKTIGYAEILRFFEQDTKGQTAAKRIADSGRNWAHTTLRHEDMEVYMFRLLLEYGRLVDDNRESLGYHK